MGLIIVGRGESGPLRDAHLAWRLSLSGAVGHVMPYPNHDRASSLLATLSEGVVLRVSPEGRVVMRARLDERADAGAVCGVLRPGDPPRIVATDVAGSVYCFDARGRRLWKHARASRSGAFRATVLADLQGDGCREILVSDSRGTLVVLDCSGRLLLEVQAGTYRVSAPAVVYDQRNPTRRALVFGNDAGDLYCISPDGQLQWARRTSHRFGRSLPVVYSPAHGPGRVLITGSFVSAAPGLLAVDAATGQVGWTVRSEVQAYQSTVCIGDGSDRQVAVVFGDKNTCLYGVDAGGSLKWKTRLEGRGIFHAPAVARLPGGEVVLFQAVRGGDAEQPALYAIRSDGSVLDGVPLGGGGGSSPLLCRFRDGSLSLVTLSGSGHLERRDLPGACAAGAILWPGPPVPRVAPVALKQALPMRTASMSSRTITLGYWACDVEPPLEATHVAVRAIRPDGSVLLALHYVPYLAMEHGSRSRKVRLRVPVERVGRYEADVRWYGERCGVLKGESYRLVLKDGLPEDGEQWRRFADALKSMATRYPSRATWLEALRDAAARAWTAATRTADAEAAERARAGRKDALALARAVARLNPAGEVMVLPDNDPWHALDLATTAARARVANRLDVRMLGNEREAVGAVVINLTDRAMDVRISVGDVTLPGGATIAGHEIVMLRTPLSVRPFTTGRLTEDPLMSLGDAGIMRLGPAEARRAWITVDSRSLPAGSHQLRLTVGDASSARRPVVATLSVHVSTVRLPQRLRYRHCNWLNPAAFPAGPVREAVIRDALEHGTSVFTLSPPAAVVEQNDHVRIIPGETHDEIARSLAGRAFLLITGLPALQRPDGGPVDPEARDRLLADMLRAYARHMEMLGYATTDYALYLMDEPGLCGPDASFRSFVEQVRRVKEAMPTMSVYANPAGGATPELLRPLVGLVDIWCPDMHLYRSDPEGFRPIFDSGCAFWHYEAGADQRNLDPLGFYRMQAWVAFQLGMQGGGYWVHSYDPYWFDAPGEASEYGAVYMTDGLPLPTKRWEATRDGIEDYELLCTVRELAASCSHSVLAREALATLDEAVAFVTAGQERASDIGRQTEPFCPDYRCWTMWRHRLMAVAERLAAQQ